MEIQRSHDSKLVRSANTERLHSKAMHLLQANVNIVYIRDLLGHESIKTTEVYARADNTLKRKALEKADPIKHKSLNFPDWNNDEDLMDWLRNLGK